MAKKYKSLILILSIVSIIFLFFIGGRYGWKLAGFSVCEGAGIENVEVTENVVNIKGFYPGSFPCGFIGYYAEEEMGELYVGFKFSALFGMFENGNFDISIPVENNITKVIIKTSYEEYVVWPYKEKRNDASEALEARSYDLGAYEDGIYIKLMRDDIYSIAWSCENESGAMQNADSTALAADVYMYLENDIKQYAYDKGEIVPFVLSFYDENGDMLTQAELEFDPKNPLVVAILDYEGGLTLK